MTVTAGIVQADLTSRQTAIFIELADLSGVNRDHVRPHVSCETLGVRCSTLDQARHMTISTIDVKRHMGGIILELGFLPMAILAENVGGLLTLSA